ncbi:hypothetical protein BDBG_17818 [Blastomyces gilchristii SLH14081]|uniref:Uncharacterized protein n=1 Tax=Blastomyces gilchristii (strain SLH14081) TaxID=559298 RepID=A0A179V1W8_BLAGS|nr:uncharacterized protein BDBG_17818 [Blastomyces gilchristii SLH14081]OAT13449.1 hypothetical protein BDBG_17818 [Blastomyces gilchristii SLH14081]
MSFFFKYSVILRITKAREHHHRLKREKKKAFKNNMNDTVCERLKKKIQELAEEKGIEALFRSQMRFMIQNIEKAALLSEHVNLLVTEVEPETADQKM